MKKQAGIGMAAAVVIVAALAATVMGAGSISTVSSFAAPNMVAEINVALQEADVRLDTAETFSNATAEVTYSNLVLNGTLTVAGDVTLTTDLTVANGGSGASTFTDGGILLGNAAGAFVALGVAANGQIPIGDNAADPVLATITGTANQIAVANGAGSITLSLATGIDAVNIGAGAVTSAEFGYISNLTSSAQDQIDALSAAGVGGVLAPAYIIVGNESTAATAVVVSGDLTLATNGEFTVADNAVLASEVGAGTFAADVVYSNAAGKVTAASVVVTGGDVQTLIDARAAESAIFDTVTITPSPNTTNLVTIQAKDANGDNMARACSMHMWFTTDTVTVTPSTNNITSFSIVQGEIGCYFNQTEASPTYIVTTTAGGLYTMNVVGADADTTNIVSVMSGNGKIVSGTLVFK